MSPWFTYLKWLSREELPSMVLGGLGIVVALYQSRSRFAVFSAFWALGMTAAYSLLPYKTPWLALNLLLPVVIMAGYFLGQWFDLGAREQSPLLRISAVLALLAAGAVSSYQAIDISFFSYDDDSIPYVYAHTRRDFLGLIDEIETVASHSPARKNIGVTIMSPEHWPLPWYLREYPNCGYYGTIVPTSEPIVVALQSQSEEIEKRMGTLYRRFHSYELRPGVWLVLYLRKDQQP
jgi:predicted membrane-bound mannosyltransferase